MTTTINKKELQKDAINFLALVELGDKKGGLKLITKIAQLPSMSKRYIKVLKLREGEGLTYKEIGDEIGVTVERACQIRYKAIENVREASEGKFRVFGSEHE